MINRLIKKMPPTLIILGALVVYGTAGASDCGTIGFKQLVIQSVIGLALAGVGVLLYARGFASE